MDLYTILSRPQIKNYKYVVYVLRCPISHEILYVGSSSNHQVRYNQHIIDSVRVTGGESNKKVWIASLVMRGYIPLFEIIKEGLNKSNAEQLEKALIKKYPNLTNVCNNNDRNDCYKGVFNDYKITHVKNKSYKNLINKLILRITNFDSIKLNPVDFRPVFGRLSDIFIDEYNFKNLRTNERKPYIHSSIIIAYEYCRPKNFGLCEDEMITKHNKLFLCKRLGS